MRNLIICKFVITIIGLGVIPLILMGFYFWLICKAIPKFVEITPSSWTATQGILIAFATAIALAYIVLSKKCLGGGEQYTKFIAKIIARITPAHHLEAALMKSECKSKKIKAWLNSGREIQDGFRLVPEAPEIYKLTKNEFTLFVEVIEYKGQIRIQRTKCESEAIKNAKDMHLVKAALNALKQEFNNGRKPVLEE